MKPATKPHTVSSLLSWKLWTLQERFTNEFYEQAADDERTVESPIEAVMLAHLRYLITGFSGGIETHQVVKAPNWDAAQKMARGMGDLEVRIFPQCQVGPYRLDFLLAVAMNGKRLWIAVECDGHDFHERTKKQAAHDKKRDRSIQAMGIRVFRFTGSEIWRPDDSLLDDLTRVISDFIEAEFRGVAHG